MKARRDLLEEMLRVLSECRHRPSANRVFVLKGPPCSGKSSLAKEVATRASGTYVDLLADKLDALEPAIGTYRPKDFQRDVVTWSRSAGGLLVIDEIEPLFDTWLRTQQADAIRLLSGSTARTGSPVLVATRISLDYSGLLGNQGKVFAIPESEG